MMVDPREEEAPLFHRVSPRDPTFYADCARCGHEIHVGLRWHVRGRLEVWCVTCSKLVFDGLMIADREALAAREARSTEPGPVTYKPKEEG
jgi:hypothetical protein